MTLEEKWQKVRECVDEYVASQVEFYSERNPYTWEENFNDANRTLTKALFEDKDFIEAMHQYINEVKGEF